MLKEMKWNILDSELTWNFDRQGIGISGQIDVSCCVATPIFPENLIRSRVEQDANTNGLESGS